jgi:hypothetical protein
MRTTGRTRAETDVGRWTIVILTIISMLAVNATAAEITGTLSPPERVTSVSVVDRGAKKTFDATYDRTTGKYRFADLPAGVYDLILETTVGRIEGVDLKVEETEPVAKRLSVTPADLDRDEIAGVADLLVKLYTERKGEKPPGTPDALVACIRENVVTAVSLVKGKPLTNGALTLQVPLRDKESAQIGDVLLGLISLAKVRDQFPRDFNLVVEFAKGGPGEISVLPVAPGMTEKDREWLVHWVNQLKIFENKKRVLDLDGTGDRARVLVEKLRDEPTTLPTQEPTAFWRIEILDFKKYYGGWSPGKFTVVVREQVPIRKFRTYRWMFEKRLGGVRATEGGVAVVPDYEVPETLDPARGRAPY